MWHSVRSSTLQVFLHYVPHVTSGPVRPQAPSGAHGLTAKGSTTCPLPGCSGQPTFITRRCIILACLGPLAPFQKAFNRHYFIHSCEILIKIIIYVICYIDTIVTFSQTNTISPNLVYATMYSNHWFPLQFLSFSKPVFSWISVNVIGLSFLLTQSPHISKFVFFSAKLICPRFSSMSLPTHLPSLVLCPVHLSFSHTLLSGRSLTYNRITMIKNMATDPSERVESLSLSELLNSVHLCHRYSIKNNGVFFWVTATIELLRKMPLEQGLARNNVSYLSV